MEDFDIELLIIMFSRFLIIANATKILSSKSRVKEHTTDELEKLLEQANDANDQDRAIKIALCMVARNSACSVGVETIIGSNSTRQIANVDKLAESVPINEMLCIVSIICP